MPLLQDRVQETTTTVGTGTFALNGAVTGYITFNSGFVNGNVVWYVCDDGNGNWEIGYGTVGTGTLTRTVFQSSNANALVSFAAGAKRIFCTAPYTYLLPDQTGNSGKILTTDGSTPSWITAPTGTVTSVSVASANGFAGTSSGGATPALTLSTTVTGLLKGNGTTISAATAGTDYAAANATFTLGSTSVALGSTTSTVAGLTLTNPTINGFTGNTSVVNIGSGQFYKDTSGNVGIGTTSPGNKLTLSDAGALSIQIASALSGGSNLLLTANGTGGEVNMVNGLPLLFKTSNTEKMRLDASGNLGLGATPSAWSAFKALQVSRASVASETSSTYFSHNWYWSGSADTYIASDYATRYSQQSGQHRWWIAPSGTAGNAISFTQAMTLDASGRLLVGDTSLNGSAIINGISQSSSNNAGTFGTKYAGDVANAAVLVWKTDNNSTTSQVFQRFAINSNGTANGQINANGSNQAAFGSWSDRRLKKNIVDLGPQLANILALRPVEFDYIESEGGGHQINFIAQEMEEVYPDAVGERGDGMKTITGWSKTEARLVKAIQEIAARLEALENK